MKKLTTLVLSLFFVVAVFATETENEKNNSESASIATKLSGKVLDKSTGEALAGVKISLNDSGNYVYTDFDGKFELTNVKPGKIEISASYISYKVKTEALHIDLNSNNTVEVKIENLSE
ncbi:MAG: hypothetical protein A2X13_01855 [Bacteroidetes bacterium GWC2_33_15]|nr:MAG: hypothetical protein A2X10_07770 [Bacteroidetes bacterium GWA2_33_15]OFX52224.1 MAG: hypothetical protein A2X13_01855 [Bacteroidetes bacterium GWC2_33_15]OFX64378.1 MAG: hypothetical protein A2X15_12675 [Bacteroidetes bacterium GWB2_32_14]OFX67783.1 MAG: hypothetical protein A2X14_06500 [Bacteroidetes bacterium GWD2_33_33]HAN19395.1 hypothetical protein [Bacteroidales bacterium]